MSDIAVNNSDLIFSQNQMKKIEELVSIGPARKNIGLTREFGMVI